MLTFLYSLTYFSARFTVSPRLARAACCFFFIVVGRKGGWVDETKRQDKTRGRGHTAHPPTHPPHRSKTYLLGRGGGRCLGRHKGFLGTALLEDRLRDGHGCYCLWMDGERWVGGWVVGGVGRDDEVVCVMEECGERIGIALHWHKGTAQPSIPSSSCLPCRG